jgi:hypothetical protein
VHTRHRLASWLCHSILLVALATGCTTPAELRVDKLGDVARYRTWGWLMPEQRQVGTPVLGDPTLDWKVSQVVHRSLEELGFRHDPDEPELLIFFHLGIRRQVVQHMRTGAIHELSSLHDSPSYRVQSSELEQQYFEIATLRIVVIGRAERRVIWRGVLEGRYPKEFGPHLEATVSSLVRRIPPPRARPGTPKETATRTSAPAPGAS